MNGRRARQIRRMAWRASTEAATRTGDPRFLTGRNVRAVYRRIKRIFVRSGEFPTTVEPVRVAPVRSAFRR